MKEPRQPAMVVCRRLVGSSSIPTGCILQDSGCAEGCSHGKPHPHNNRCLRHIDTFYSTHYNTGYGYDSDEHNCICSGENL